MIQESDGEFVAKVKENQKELQEMVQEIEEVSAIDSHYTQHIKQSDEEIRRDVFVYTGCTYFWHGVMIRSIIRIDKSVNGNITTHYYISNTTGSAETFLEKILGEWRVETMHFYKDTALKEDQCKVNKSAFALSILRSFVLNILHLNKVKNIGRQIVKNTYDLAEALTLVSMARLLYGIVKL